MDDWMMLQAQMHQGQSHFASAHTRAPDTVDPGSRTQAVTDVSLLKPQNQQQPLMHGFDESECVG